jgi:O-antigen/teichoic acid export membrane protein
MKSKILHFFWALSFFIALIYLFVMDYSSNIQMIGLCICAGIFLILHSIVMTKCD